MQLSGPLVTVEEDGAVTRAVLHAVLEDTFTGLAYVEAARKFFAEIAVPGFQTDAVTFGNDFVLVIPPEVQFRLEYRLPFTSNHNAQSRAKI